MEGAAWWGQGLEGRLQALHRPGSDLGRGAMGLQEPSAMGQPVRSLATSQAKVWGSLTAGITTNEESSYFIIHKDEEAVGGGTEPPGYPEESKSWSAEEEIVAGNCFVYCVCRVRELEKARFRKRMRPALYRNRSPLMRREGAAVRLVSYCTNPREE